MGMKLMIVVTQMMDAVYIKGWKLILWIFVVIAAKILLYS